MARDFAKAFYRSKAWKNTRNYYFRSRNGLCERCLAKGKLTPAEIVHHVEHLTPSNINDPNVSLSFENLECVCRECHAEEHPEIYQRNSEREPDRVSFDEYGNVVRLDRIDYGDTNKS